MTYVRAAESLDCETLRHPASGHGPVTLTRWRDRGWGRKGTYIQINVCVTGKTKKLRDETSSSQPQFCLDKSLRRGIIACPTVYGELQLAAGGTMIMHNHKQKAGSGG
jgi:hypothetical protein